MIPAPLVVKLGGSVELSDELAAELATRAGPLVLIHGGHRDLDELTGRLGHPARMVTSPRGETARYTDATTMDHFLMAYCGLRNKRIVERLRRAGADAVGFAALDGGTVIGRRRDHLRIQDGDRVRLLRDNFTGSINHVDPRLLHLLIADGRLPVLTPPALSEDGHAINVDGDRLAAEVAVALGASKLLILMDAPGLLRSLDDPTSVVPRIDAGSIGRSRPLALGRAAVKLDAAERALAGGVARVILATGYGPAPLAAAEDGGGTHLTGSQS
ncbi:MAG: [LysW]-aminoadipate kinase [Candidatus Dormibacteria bacterium]